MPTTAAGNRRTVILQKRNRLYFFLGFTSVCGYWNSRFKFNAGTTMKLSGRENRRWRRRCRHYMQSTWKWLKLRDFIALDLFSIYLYLDAGGSVSVPCTRTTTHSAIRLRRFAILFYDFSFARTAILCDFFRIRQLSEPSSRRTFQLASFAWTAYLSFGRTHAWFLSSIWNSIIPISLWKCLTRRVP